MLKKIYSVYDRKVEAYGTPFVQQNEALAIRSFERAYLNPELDFSLFPEDYSLFELGTYNEDTGQIESTSPRLILNATALKGR